MYLADIRPHARRSRRLELRRQSCREYVSVRRARQCISMEFFSCPISGSGAAGIGKKLSTGRGGARGDLDQNLGSGGDGSQRVH